MGASPPAAMTRRRRLLVWTASVLAAFVIAFLALRTPDSDVNAMIAKYGREPSRFLTLPAAPHVHVRDTGGDIGQPVLVMLHGTSSSLHTWSPLVDRLKMDYRIITIDLPGHGLTGSTTAKRYDIPEMLTVVDQTMDALGVRKFTLIGNSMGGRVSWRYALAHPDKVQSLVLMDASGMPLRPGEEPPPLNFGFRLARNPVGRVLLTQFTPRSLVRRSIEETVANPRMVDDVMVDRYWELIRFPGNRQAAIARFTQPLVDDNPARIGAITQPVLIVFGAEDRLIHPTAAKTFHERLPQSEVVLVPGVGHLPQEEAPDHIADVMRRFLHANGLGGSRKSVN